MVNKKRGRKFSLKKQYKQSWEYIKESKNFILAIIGVFLLFTILGSALSVPEDLSNAILELIEKLIEETQGLSQLALIKYIFFNNIQSSFFGLILGVFLEFFQYYLRLLMGMFLGLFFH